MTEQAKMKYMDSKSNMGLKIIDIGFGDFVHSISFRREDSSKIEGRFKESFMDGLARRLVQTAPHTFLTNF